MLILNYLLAKEYKNIFMLQGDERSLEIPDIINFFDGGILIINQNSHEVLFHSEQIKQPIFNIIFNGTITSEAVFKFLIGKNKNKDRVNLYEES